ncbi:MAG: hypothetical protein QXP02_00455 [Desulfurococcaceae archaeon]
MVKVFVSIDPKYDCFDVEVWTYTQAGKLEKTERYRDVKQIVIKNAEVRISRQLSRNPLVLVIDCEKPIIELRENTLLYISG